MRRTVMAIACVLIALIVVPRAQGPTAGPEHKRLAYFVGTWNFSGEAKASPMGAAGPVTKKETCEMMDGGFAIVCRSEGKVPTGTTRAVAIMTYDAEKKAYTYTAAESNMPVINAVGQVKGPTWTWTVHSNMGRKPMTTRVTTTEAGPTAYDFTMEMSVEKGAFTPLISGKWTKAK